MRKPCKFHCVHGVYTLCWRCKELSMHGTCAQPTILDASWGCIICPWPMLAICVRQFLLCVFDLVSSYPPPCLLKSQEHKYMYMCASATPSSFHCYTPCTCEFYQVPSSFFSVCNIEKFLGLTNFIVVLSQLAVKLVLVLDTNVKSQQLPVLCCVLVHFYNLFHLQFLFVDGIIQICRHAKIQCALNCFHLDGLS